MKTYQRLLWAGVLFFAGISSGGADEAITIRLSENVLRAPAYLRITVLVEKNKDNRRLKVEADSSEYYRSSETALEGLSAPRAHDVVFRSLPEGQYQIRASVEGMDGSRARAERTAIVVGAGDKDLTPPPPGPSPRPPRGRR
jgi:hypothetical protein